MTEAQRTRFEALLTSNKQQFTMPDRVVTRSDVLHRIRLYPDAQIVNVRPHRLAPEDMAELEEKVNELLARGRIEASESAWGAPVVFVWKKDKTKRMCIDYRGLNRWVVPIGHPAPDAAEFFDALGGAGVFTALDAQNAYWHIPIAPEDRYLTAFNTHIGTYQWNCLPFGLRTSAAGFQRWIDRMFQAERNKFVVVFLDDILVYSHDVDKHLEHLDTVFQRLRENGLYLKFGKCKWLQESVSYLGHVVGKEGISTDPEKCEVIRNWARPKSAAEVGSFLGLANYYRRFIQKCRA